MYYITQGVVILLHRESCTFIKEVSEDCFIGEVSFFSGYPRKASARAKYFSQVLVLEKSSFLEIAYENGKALEVFEYINTQIMKYSNLAIIGVQCYVCDEMGHLSVDCGNFKSIEGNISHLIDSG